MLDEYHEILILGVLAVHPDMYLSELCKPWYMANVLPETEVKGSKIRDIHSLVPRHQVFHTHPVALSNNRVWTLSLLKLVCNHISVTACCCTIQIAQVK